MSLPLDEPVRLKSEFADVYALAAPGAVGFARRRKDDEGFKMVFIEWDQSHWAYSGESDKWTFENHFEPVKDETKMSDEKRKLPADLLAGIEELFAEYQNSDEGETKVEVEVPESDLFDIEGDEEFANRAKRAGEAAAEGTAFVLIGVSETEFEGEKALVPYVVSSYKNETAGLFLETQIADFAGAAFRNAAIVLMSKIKREKDAEKE